jgi:hypothetical protein
VETNVPADLLSSTDFADARPLVDVEGMSSPRVCNLLNHLVARMDPGEQYLEIGTWQGLTLLSAALGNQGRVCIGCDKFRVFGRYTGFGFLARRRLRRNLARYAGRTAEIRMYELPSASFFAAGVLSAPIGVYFYDGDHSYRGTRESMIAAARWLSPRAAILVDDWNVPKVRRGALDGLEAAQIRVLWQRDLEGDHSPRGWWNGLGAFYVEAPTPSTR